jgi:hypothetical protein
MILICRRCKKAYYGMGLLDLCECGGKGDSEEELYFKKHVNDVIKDAETNASKTTLEFVMERNELIIGAIISIAMLGVAYLIIFELPKQVFVQAEQQSSFKGTYTVGQPIARYYTYGSDKFHIFYFGIRDSEALFTIIVSGSSEEGKASFQFTMPKGSTLMIDGKKYKIGTFNSSEITLE